MSSTSPDPGTRPAPPGLDHLVEGHMELLRHYVRAKAGRNVRAKEPLSDLVQSVLREVYAARSSDHASAVAFRRWLCAVAAHKIISKNRYYEADRRDQAREEPLSETSADPERSDGASPSARAERSEELERLQRALEELDPEDRELLVLRRIFEVPIAEIADKCGLAESTVRQRLGRIMADLAFRLS